MTDHILFHIIIVSYRAGEKLVQTAENVLAQSHERIRVTVQDGMSDDGSVQELMNRCGGDERLVVHAEKDDGIYDAMNRAVGTLAAPAREAEQYCIFMNCGDRFFDADVLKKAAHRISQVNRRMATRAQVAPVQFSAGLFYGDTFDRKTGQVVSAMPEMNDFACYRHLPWHQSCIYDLALLKKESYETKWTVRADYELFLRLKYLKGVRPVYLQMTIADYEGGGFSETEENRKVSEDERRDIIAMYLPRKKVKGYDLYRVLSLQRVRQRLADHPKTAKLYQEAKRRIYRKKRGEQT